MSLDSEGPVAAARRALAERQRGYRAQALKLFPWVCAHCGRSFDHRNVQQLTVHHKNHNHDDNPPDGSNWELLCIYCHENAHDRDLAAAALKGGTPAEADEPAKWNPFAGLRKE